MTKFDELKGELQRRLDCFTYDDLEAIEGACIKFLESDSLLEADSALRNTAVYLLLKLAGDLKAIWGEGQPALPGGLHESLQKGAWEPFREFAHVALEAPAAERLIPAFQKALRAIAVRS